jgi:hypothetical protein
MSGIMLHGRRSPGAGHADRPHDDGSGHQALGLAIDNFDLRAEPVFDGASAGAVAGASAGTAALALAGRRFPLDCGALPDTGLAVAAAGFAFVALGFVASGLSVSVSAGLRASMSVGAGDRTFRPRPSWFATLRRCSE